MTEKNFILRIIKNLIISYTNSLTVEAERNGIINFFKQKNENIIYISVFLSFIIKLSYFVFLIYVTLNAVNGSKTFMVNAKTEYFEYIPESLSPPRIHLSNAIIINKKNENNLIESKSNSKYTANKEISFCSVEVHGKSKFIFSRMDNGPVRILIISKKTVLYDEYEEIIDKYTDDIEIIFSNQPSPGKEFNGWLYNIDGEITIGRTPTLGVAQVNGMLIEGELQTLAKKFWTDNPYSIDLIKLKFGDKIQFTLNSLPSLSSGLVTVDENRGLQVMATSKADSAIIKKPRDTLLILKNSLWSVLQQDELLSFAWACLFFIVGFFSFVIKFLSFYKLNNIQIK